MRISRRRFLIGLAVLLGLPNTPAWAHHKPGHRRWVWRVPLAQVASTSLAQQVTGFRISEFSDPVEVAA